MPGGHNFSRSETLLGLGRCDVTAACYFPLKAAVFFFGFFFKRAPHKEFQQSEGLFGQNKKSLHFAKIRAIFLSLFYHGCGAPVLAVLEVVLSGIDFFCVFFLLC